MRAFLFLSLLTICCHSAQAEEQAKLPNFRMQEIATDLGVGYAVRLLDINEDGKLDIVAVDKRRIVWYENPSWKRRTIIEDQTAPDNVCFAPYDIDGDGKLDLAIGAGWGNLSSKVPGPIYWARRKKSLDEKWDVFPIFSENSVHRIRFADVDGNGRKELLVAPLLGKGSTSKNNFMDAPIRLIALHIPKDPVKDRWKPEIIDNTLHVMHNFWPVSNEKSKAQDLLTVSYEGVHRHHRTDKGWQRTKIGTGNQENPKARRGASEIKLGKLKNGKQYIATIEPWHGNQVVVYTPSDKKLWKRHVIDDHLKWGHAVWCADLTGDGNQELIIGVRDDLSKKSGQRRGVRIYDPTNWQRKLIDEGGVAVEDLAAGDLNGDGRIDIVAVGRQTHNCRIYWNQK